MEEDRVSRHGDDKGQQKTKKKLKNKVGWLIVTLKSSWDTFKMKSESIQEILAG